MSTITNLYSGIYYPPTPSFIDRINISKEFEPTNIDDNELLKFHSDGNGRLSIIELSEIPYIDYNNFNWDTRNYDSKYKWYYFSSDHFPYKLCPSGSIIPYNLPPEDDFWTINSYYIETIDNISYFKYNTFMRTDFTHPTGWITNNDPYLSYNATIGYWKSNYEELEKNQYKPISLLIGSDSNYIEGKDKTKYKENQIPILDKNDVNSIQALQYYFDGQNLITNYNFSDENIRKNVHVIYNYLPNKFKLLAKLYTNENGFSEYTPIIDNYILKISTQKINK